MTTGARAACRAFVSHRQDNLARKSFCAPVEVHFALQLTSNHAVRALSGIVVGPPDQVQTSSAIAITPASIRAGEPKDIFGSSGRVHQTAASSFAGPRQVAHHKPPTRQGFGARVIDSMIRGQLKGEMQFDWRAEGLACEIVLPV